MSERDPQPTDVPPGGEPTGSLLVHRPRRDRLQQRIVAVVIFAAVAFAILAPVVGIFLFALTSMVVLVIIFVSREVVTSQKTAKYWREKWHETSAYLFNKRMMYGYGCFMVLLALFQVGMTVIGILRHHKDRGDVLYFGITRGYESL